jgi:hypothetical protein
MSDILDVDGLVKKAVDAAAEHIPGGDKVEELINSEAGQNITNKISEEVSKGVEGAVDSVQGLLGKE